MIPKKLHIRLQDRAQQNALRSLPILGNLIDFSSNDYLGLSRDTSISSRALNILKEHTIYSNGATGSRLLSGNHKLYALAESMIARFHESETALIFNSGYDANIGFFQAVPQRGDVIYYDEHIHASIRDGLRMSHAKAYKFKHNNLDDLERLLSKRTTLSAQEQETYIVTEAVFSMDGDSPDLKKMAALCASYKSHLVVDEAHATGITGIRGQGLVQKLGLQHKVFACIVTFGKAMGAHGAAVLGSDELKQYLVNFARSFIYTTGLPPHSIATIMAAYETLDDVTGITNLNTLRSNIQFFNLQISNTNLKAVFIPSTSAIHCAVIPGNERVKALSRKLQEQGFNVKPILSPTVPEDQERLRFCLHSFNTEEEIGKALKILESSL